MTATRPETIANTLIDDVLVHVRSGVNPNAFDKKQLERRISDLKPVDAVEGWMIDALFAGLLWDKNRVASSARNARTLSNSSITVLLNLAQAYRFAGLYQEAAEFSDEALARSPASADAINLALDTALYLGDLNRVREIAANAMRQKINPKLMGELNKIQIDLSDEPENVNVQFKIEAKIALDTLTEAGLRCTSFSQQARLDPANGERSLSAIYRFPGTLQMEIERESVLISRLVELPNWNPNVLHIIYEAMGETS